MEEFDINNIPSYLINSQFYINLDKEDLKTISIPKHNFKYDMTISNLNDLLELIQTVEFWNVLDYQVYHMIFSYCADNYKLLINKFKIWTKLYENKLLNELAICVELEFNYDQIFLFGEWSEIFLQWSIISRRVKLTCKIISCLLNKNMESWIEKFSIISNSINCEITHELIVRIILLGNLSLIKYIINSGFKIKKNIINNITNILINDNDKIKECKNYIKVNREKFEKKIIMMPFYSTWNEVRIEQVIKRAERYNTHNSHIFHNLNNLHNFHK